MKINKILLTSILLLAILTLGAVSAAEDVNLTASDAGDDTIVESSMEDVEVEDTNLGVTDDSELSVDPDINVELENDVGEVNGYFTLNVTRSSEDAYEWGEIVYYMDDKDDEYWDNEFTIGSATPQNFELNIAIGEVKMNSAHTIYVNCYDDDGMLIKDYEFPVTVTGFYMGVYTDDGAEWGGDIPIHFSMPERALGTINFTFNGKTYTVRSDDNSDFDLDIDGSRYNTIIKKEDVICGVNNIVAKYTPSGKYGFKEKTINVNMTILSKIHFSDDDVDYNGEDTIWLSLPSDATGKLLVTIDGESYTVNPDNGKYVFHYPLLDLDDYEVTVKYLGDDYEMDYGVDEIEGTPLTCVSNEITILPYLNVTSMNWDRDKFDMSIIMPSKYNGNVTFWRGTDYEDDCIIIGTAVIKDGIATASFKVGPGEHNLNAYVECGEYEGASKEKDVEVVYESSKWNMNLDVQSMIRKGDNQLLLALKNLPEHIVLSENDNLILKIDGVEFGEWYIYDTSDGEIYINPSNLNYGKHSFELIFLGDGYFEPKSESGYFEVGTVSIYIPKEVDTDDLHDFNIIMPKDATGNVILYINGKKIESLKITEEAYYEDDEDYLEVGFYLYDLMDNCGVYDVSIRKTSGNYQFRLDTKVNVTYYLYADESVVYGGDRLYIHGPMTDYGGTGQVSVKIDGVSYKVSSDYDEDYAYNYYVLTPSDLAPGTHNISISYSGDSMRPARTVQSTFEVIPTVFYDTEYAHVGDGISLIMPNDAKGNLTVIVDNKLYKTVKAKGNVFISFDDAPHGYHVVDVMYDGDDYYVHTEKPGSLEITKFKVPEKMYYKGSDAVSVELPSDIKGKLFVDYTDSNDEDQSIEVELVKGKASIPLSMLPSGDQSIWVTVKWDVLMYVDEETGEEEWYEDYYDCQFVVDVVNPISSSSSAISSSDYAIKVIDIDRKPVSGASVDVYLDGKKVKTVKTNSKGYAYYKVDKAPKTYNLKLVWKGHTVTKKLKVTHVVTLKSVTVKKSAKKLVLTATLKKVNGKYIKSKKVTFKFNGKKYTAKTNSKGVAKLTIKSSILKKLTVGKKVTYQATYGKDTVKKTVKVKK